MPVHRKGSGFQWGNHGKVYPSKAGAVKQMKAAFANGYKEKSSVKKRVSKKGKKKTP